MSVSLAIDCSCLRRDLNVNPSMQRWCTKHLTLVELVYILYDWLWSDIQVSLRRQLQFSGAPMHDSHPLLPSAFLLIKLNNSSRCWGYASRCLTCVEHSHILISTWWSLLHLQARAAAEVTETLQGRTPNGSDTRQLPYIEAVVLEALRLYSPAYMWVSIVYCHLYNLMIFYCCKSL